MSDLLQTAAGCGFPFFRNSSSSRLPLSGFTPWHHLAFHGHGTLFSPAAPFPATGAPTPHIRTLRFPCTFAPPRRFGSTFFPFIRPPMIRYNPFLGSHVPLPASHPVNPSPLSPCPATDLLPKLHFQDHPLFHSHPLAPINPPFPPAPSISRHSPLPF